MEGVCSCGGVCASLALGLLCFRDLGLHVSPDDDPEQTLLRPQGLLSRGIQCPWYLQQQCWVCLQVCTVICACAAQYRCCCGCMRQQQCWGGGGCTHDCTNMTCGCMILTRVWQCLMSQLYEDWGWWMECSPRRRCMCCVEAPMGKWPLAGKDPSECSCSMYWCVATCISVCKESNVPAYVWRPHCSA